MSHQPNYLTNVLNIAEVKKTMIDRGNVTITYDNKDKLIIEKSSGEYYQIGYVSYYQVMYAEHELNDDNESTYMCVQTQYFPLARLHEARACFVGRMSCSNPGRAYGNSYSLGDVKVINTGKLSTSSRLAYANEVFMCFANNALSAPIDLTYSMDIIFRHIDKIQTYAGLLNAHKIPFHHGVLLLLLANTREMSPTVTTTTGNWIIDNYDKYKSIINETEAKILKTVYGSDGRPYAESQLTAPEQTQHS